jgi:hypothetical protein
LIFFIFSSSIRKTGIEGKHLDWIIVQATPRLHQEPGGHVHRTFTDTIQPATSTAVMRLDAAVVGRTPERIVASSFYDGTSAYYRGGYVAEASGQVLSYTYTFSGVMMLANIAGTSCTYSRAAASATLLPEWAYWIICGGLAVLAIGMAALAVKHGRRKS